MLAIHVAVGIIFNAKKEILVSKRAAHKFQGDRWEFPGGKIESNEDAFTALRRELDEEIGIHVIDAKPLWKIEFSYHDKNILLDIWEVTQFTGEAHSKEGQEIQWVSLATLATLEIPDANQIIVE